MKKLLTLSLIFLMWACSSSPSIQQYYVEKSQDPSFLVMDIPTSILGIDQATLNDEEREALSSFQKFNILLFRKTDENQNQFDNELDTVRGILDNKTFDPLLVLSDPEYSGKLVLQGSLDRPDEIIFFGSSIQGFIVARLIGRKMQVDKAMLLAGVLQREGAMERAAKHLGQMF